jgi:hypothetical protein
MTVEKALVSVIQEAKIAGVSTRRVDDLVQAMGMTGVSKSSVSKLCKDIDERVNAFLKPPLAGKWPYLWLDATYLKVREGGRIVSVAAIIAVAVNTEGTPCDRRLAYRSFRSRAILVHLPARSRPLRPQGHQAGHLGRAGGCTGTLLNPAPHQRCVDHVRAAGRPSCRAASIAIKLDDCNG